ncbi:MAG TPA: DUF998 domain-containing protein [Nitrososphaerales archaeon]|nr:DUF998 domain-containing protein [Nitrososphaerales archaeon]
MLSAATIFVIFNTIAEGSFPDYNTGTNALSNLGAIGSPTRSLWDGQLFIVGVLGTLGMFILFRSPALKINNKSLTSIVYLLPNVGSILVALFPENFIPIVHAPAAFMVFIFGGISAVYAYRFTSAPFRYFSVLMGITALASIVATIIGAPLGFGLLERLIVYPYVIWGLAFGAYLMSLPIEIGKENVAF